MKKETLRLVMKSQATLRKITAHNLMNQPIIRVVINPVISNAKVVIASRVVISSVRVAIASRVVVIVNRVVAISSVRAVTSVKVVTSSVPVAISHVTSSATTLPKWQLKTLTNRIMLLLPSSKKDISSKADTSPVTTSNVRAVISSVKAAIASRVVTVSKVVAIASRAVVIVNKVAATVSRVVTSRVAISKAAIASPSVR